MHYLRESIYMDKTHVKLKVALFGCETFIITKAVFNPSCPGEAFILSVTTYLGRQPEHEVVRSRELVNLSS